MDTENPSAPSCAQPRVAAKKHPNRGSGGGLIHEHTRHTSHFTVVGNDLAQHPDLSGLAIGIGTHIQSLPAGAKVDIKTLAERLKEGRTRIAAALRELEAVGYLRREHVRLPDGRIITRTVFCNRPGHSSRARQPAAAATATATARPKPSQKPARKAALPPVPQPSCAAPALLQQSLDLLVRLRRHDSRLLLSATDTEHLAPGVAAWLERDVSAAAVTRALTSDLPAEDLRRPAALLAHRLTDRLPPPPPFRTPAPQPPVAIRVHNCDSCDRGFRSPIPGLCRDCRTDPPGGRLA
ncbi:helix-turn-helix domain-containing protein [Streptomyces sp. NPDC048282]|uniref:helix-turn-helix domain-containing protein n=1 Tax=Streptomyces sp. NPDC048282 TaxID=3365528 RepID=UPI0037242EF5